MFRRGGRFLVFAVAALGPRIELAHALTIHKAQGSEFDAVAVLLPSEPIPLLTREILYTAITRARRSVTLVGSEALIRHGITHTVERSSGLAGFLARRA